MPITCWVPFHLSHLVSVLTIMLWLDCYCTCFTNKETRTKRIDYFAQDPKVNQWQRMYLTLVSSCLSLLSITQREQWWHIHGIHCPYVRDDQTELRFRLSNFSRITPLAHDRNRIWNQRIVRNDLQVLPIFGAIFIHLNRGYYGPSGSHIWFLTPCGFFCNLQDGPVSLLMSTSCGQ